MDNHLHSVRRLKGYLPVWGKYPFFMLYFYTYPLDKKQKQGEKGGFHALPKAARSMKWKDHQLIGFIYIDETAGIIVSF
jgi:hypothetical protein